MRGFVLSLSIIVASLYSGYVFNICIDRGLVPLTKEQSERLRLALQKTVLLAINPIAFCGAVWIADLRVGSYFALPFISLVALAAGLGLGFAGSWFFRLPAVQAGVYIGSSSFTNIGNLGGLAVFIFLGEAGFALIPLYQLFEQLWYYSILFPLARSYGERANPSPAGALNSPGPVSGPASVLRQVLRDPFLFLSALAILLGLILNFSGTQRPSFYASLNLLLVPASTFLMLFAIGMRLRFRIGRGHIKAALTLTAGKILIVPSVALAAALLLGLGQVPGNLGLKLVLILSAMPTGFLSLVPPALYRLDQDFAGSIWLVSNTAIIVILPILGFLLRL